MCSSLLRWKLVLTFGLLAFASPSLRAQDAGIKWRSDYTQARKEAETKNMPLFIDFVRPACIYCDKMDQYTFRDARILRMLNEQFIPLRINGLEQPKLAGDLQINAYPTLVLADPDGRNPQILQGYREADVLHELLNRLLTRLTPPDTMQKDYQAAQKCETAGDYARAISALRNILSEDKGRPMHKDAQALLQKIEKRAGDNLSRAREMQRKGQLAETLELLADVQRQFAGLQESKDAGDLIVTIEKSNVDLRTTQRTKRVRELLAQAQEFYKSKDYVPCLNRCDKILSEFGDLPEGQRAFLLASEIKNNPEWLQGAADVMADQLGGIWLALSDTCLKRGEVRQAETHLKRVIQAFPGSRLAESAQIRLTQLQAAMPRTEVQRAGPP